MARPEAQSRVEAARRVSVMGVPLELGAGRPGCIMGPAALRTAGLVGRLQQLGFDVDDEGDVAPEPAAMAKPAWTGQGAGPRHAAMIGAWIRVLSAEAERMCREGRVPLFLGGDHSLSMGSIHGVARHLVQAGGELWVLWVDAHADFNTPATSPSGNLHGMSLAWLCQEPGITDFVADLSPAGIAPGQVHILGARSIDPGERQLLKQRGVGVVDMRQIDEHGVMVPMRRLLEAAHQRGARLHVSLDVDALDPQVAPGVGTTVPGGLTYREAHLIMELIYESGLLASMDVVELNPFLDERGRSACVLAELVASAFGQTVIERPTTAAWPLPEG